MSTTHDEGIEEGSYYHRYPADHLSAESAGSLQRWSLTCKLCGESVVWEAEDFFDAADKLPQGWGTERGVGTTCPVCKGG